MEMHLCGLEKMMKKIKEKIKNKEYSVEGSTYEYYRY